jgi:hypothetical protein
MLRKREEQRYKTNAKPETGTTRNRDQSKREKNS